MRGARYDWHLSAAGETADYAAVKETNPPRRSIARGTFTIRQWERQMKRVRLGNGELNTFEKLGLSIAFVWIIVGLILTARNVALIAWSAT